MTTSSPTSRAQAIATSGARVRMITGLSALDAVVRSEHLSEIPKQDFVGGYRIARITTPSQPANPLAFLLHLKRRRLLWGETESFRLQVGQNIREASAPAQCLLSRADLIEVCPGIVTQSEPHARSVRRGLAQHSELFAFPTALFAFPTAAVGAQLDSRIADPCSGAIQRLAEA